MVDSKEHQKVKEIVGCHKEIVEYLASKRNIDPTFSYRVFTDYDLGYVSEDTLDKIKMVNKPCEVVRELNRLFDSFRIVITKMHTIVHNGVSVVASMAWVEFKFSNEYEKQYVITLTSEYAPEGKPWVANQSPKAIIDTIHYHLSV